MLRGGISASSLKGIKRINGKLERVKIGIKEGRVTAAASHSYDSVF